MNTVPATGPEHTGPISARGYDPWVSSSRSALVRRALRPVALGIVLVFAAVFIVENWAGIRTGISRLDPVSVGWSLLTILLGLFAAMMSWRALLTGMGSSLPTLAASRVYFLGQLGKYIPGSVWTILAQTELSKEYGVPRARAAIASLTQLIVGVVVGIVVAAVSLAASSGAALLDFWWLLIVVVGGVVALLPPVLNRVIVVSSRILRRPVETSESVAGRAILVSALWCALMWLAFGVHLWLLARGVGAPAAGLLLLTTGAYALAGVVGLVIIILPAGAGAREATLLLVLAPVLDRDNALALALVSRFLMLLGDLASAGAAICGELVHRRRHPVPATE